MEKIEAKDSLEIQIFVNFAITTIKYYFNHPEEDFSIERQRKIVLSFQSLL